MEQMEQQLNLQADIAQIHNTTFQVQKTKESFIVQSHEFMADPKFKQYFETLYLLRSWILEPYSLWTPEYFGMCSEVFKQLRETGTIDPLLIDIIHNYRDLPARPLRDIIAERELCVQKGDYDWCITDKGKDKYVLSEQAIFEDEEIKADFAKLEKHHDVAKYQSWSNDKVIRRRMTTERNFRSKERNFRWGTPWEKYVEHLDSICARHGLLGFRGATPLLAKIAVYGTPHSLRIDIPWHSNPDIKRDLNLPEITRVLRAAGVGRRGPKLLAMRQAMDKRAKLAYATELEGIQLGYKGEELMVYVCEKSGLRPDMDEGNYRRTLRHGKELTLGKKAANKKKSQKNSAKE
ncbi:MAG: hypothetical protein JWM68_361 [Verrucomicrobiales bacterium]|nr:hypothetical protein [Verrucomicrobiales bacterium]